MQKYFSTNYSCQQCAVDSTCAKSQKIMTFLSIRHCLSDTTTFLDFYRYTVTTLILAVEVNI